MKTLIERLSAQATTTDQTGQWPQAALDDLATCGVYRWFVPEAYDGHGWSDGQIIDGYAKLAGACLTTAFILTQRSAATRRIVLSDNQTLKSRLLPQLAAGDTFATVAISHLSTSRRHTGSPALEAIGTAGGYTLTGTSYWVTGAAHADYFVVGAESVDGQLIALIPRAAVRVAAPQSLVALNGSCTAAIHLDEVFVPSSNLLTGPCKTGFGTSRTGGTGGIQTSALALGLAERAAAFVTTEAQARPALTSASQHLESRLKTLRTDLIAFADGQDDASKVDLRRRANELVLESTQLALTVAKGTGYLAHRAPGRWCREALFFLVWSLPN